MDIEVSRSIIRDIDLVSMSHPFALPLDPIELTREQARILADEILQMNTEPRWAAKEPTQLLDEMVWHTPTFPTLHHNCRCSSIELWTKPTLWQRVRRWAARLLRKVAAKCDDSPHYYR